MQRANEISLALAPQIGKVGGRVSQRGGLLRAARTGGCQMKCFTLMLAAIMLLFLLVHKAPAQERKIERIRVGGGSASTTQMSMWFAKEGNFYDKQGLNVEAISIPGSSLALQAMLSGELPIIQLGGAASIQANLAGD